MRRGQVFDHFRIPTGEDKELLDIICSTGPDYGHSEITCSKCSTNYYLTDSETPGCRGSSSIIKCPRCGGSLGKYPVDLGYSLEVLKVGKWNKKIMSQKKGS